MSRAETSSESPGSAEAARASPGGMDLPAWVTEPRAGTSLEMRHADAGDDVRRIMIDRARCCVVGRHDGEFNVVVDHVTVSRRHALLLHKGDRVCLYDISSNGSSVNGSKVAKKEYVELSVGDTLRFGESPCTFTLSFQPQDAGASNTRQSVPPIPATRREDCASAPEPTARRASGKAAGSPHVNPCPPATAAHSLIIFGLKLHLSAKGLEIRTVEPNSVAELHSFPFSWGDIVTSIDGVTTDGLSKDALAHAVASARERESVQLGIKKGGELQVVTLNVDVGKVSAGRIDHGIDVAGASNAWQARLAGAPLSLTQACSHPPSSLAVLRRWMRASLRARSHRVSNSSLPPSFPRSLSFERPLSPSFSAHTSIFPHVGSCAKTDVTTHNVSAFLPTVNDGRYAAEFGLQGRETARRAAVKPRSDSFPPRCGSSVEK